MTKKEYLDKVSAQFDETPKEYAKNMKYNFVILEDGELPICWENGLPVIYGGEEDYKEDLADGDKVITEQEYYDKFLTD